MPTEVRLRLYVIPNGRGAKALLCPECLKLVADLVESDYMIRCDVGLRHAYACNAVTRGWLAGRKMCGPDERTSLVAHVRRLRPVLDDRNRKMLDGFLGLLALARG